MGQSDDASKAWYCKTCKLGNGQPYDNRPGRMRCFKCGVRKGNCHLTDVPPKSPSKRVGGISACGGGGPGGGGGGGAKSAKEKQLEQRVKDLQNKLRETQGKGTGKGGDPKPKTYSEAAQADSADAKLKADLEYFQGIVDWGKKSGKNNDDPFVSNALQKLVELKAKREAEKPMSKQLLEAHRSVEQWRRKVAEKENLAEIAREKMQKAIEFSKAADNVLLNARNGLETAQKHQESLTSKVQQVNIPEICQLPEEQREQIKKGFEKMHLETGIDVGKMVDDLLLKNMPAVGAHSRPPPPIPASVPGSGKGETITLTMPPSVPDSSRVEIPVVPAVVVVDNVHSHSTQVQTFSISSQVDDADNGGDGDAEDDDMEDEAAMEARHRAEKESIRRRKSAKGRRKD